MGLTHLIDALITREVSLDGALASAWTPTMVKHLLQLGAKDDDYSALLVNVGRGDIDVTRILLQQNLEYPGDKRPKRSATQH